MGANAIRTSHNMPAPELVELCDEMGMMLMVEPFDDWGFRPKSPNGYGSFFNEWAARDITNMVEHFRNSPSVVMWSIGNEVPSQWGPDGMSELTMLRDLVHTLDPTRPVTCGMDQIGTVLDNGFAAALDIPAVNYKPQYYDKAYAVLPQKLVLGSETASTVSPRAACTTSVEFGEHFTMLHPDKQSNSYDNESCSWSEHPRPRLRHGRRPRMGDRPVRMDGLRLPRRAAPYDTDAWPSHSSYFGIIDLASPPKTATTSTARAGTPKAPHCTRFRTGHGPGREGQTTPVYVYTSYPEAELFLNGKSMGRRSFDKSNTIDRYRLRWNDVAYEPGELRVVAYKADGTPAEERTIRTVGKLAALRISANRSSIAAADGDELVYFTVTAVDSKRQPRARSRQHREVRSDRRRHIRGYRQRRPHMSHAIPEALR